MRHRGERVEVGPRRVGRELARAEQQARRRGWTVEWDYDPEPYDPGDNTDYVPNEVYWARLVDQDGETLASLGGIDDPTPEYRRVVEAELADEALARERTARRGRR